MLYNMPNASRYLEKGHTYHLTHRCHDKKFLLKFARDRDLYRKWLREGVRRYGVSVYNYCITSNHVHIVANVDDADSVSSMVQLVAATLARHWNRRKGHEGSYWEHPFKCTRIQDGKHLLRCIKYVSLNMVRAGVISHPDQWKWCGHDELIGKRTRYTILSPNRLLNSLDISSAKAFRELYISGLKDDIDKEGLKREPVWTESLAVGNREFVEKAAQAIFNRSRFKYLHVEGFRNLWSVKETSAAYRPYSTPKSACKA
jgi:putative transposase